MITTIDELEEASARLDREPCSILVENLLVIDNSYSVAHQNSLELAAFFDLARGDLEKKIELLQDYNTRRERDRHNVALFRLLFNLLASSISLRDHARRVYEGLLEGRAELEEYRQEIRNRFVGVETVKFVEDYRNYISHFSNKGIVYQPYLFTEDSKTRFLFNRDTLLQWGGWTSVSRPWLERQENEFEIHVPLNDYYTRISDFYEWLEEASKRWFREEIDDYNERVENLLEVQARIQKENKTQHHKSDRAGELENVIKKTDKLTQKDCEGS